MERVEKWFTALVVTVLAALAGALVALVVVVGALVPVAQGKYVLSSVLLGEYCRARSAPIVGPDAPAPAASNVKPGK